MYPPLWMITEGMTFGAWSVIYADIPVSDQRDIARTFCLHSNKLLGSWFHTLSHLHNLCAHHNRVEPPFYGFCSQTYQRR
ncbi:Abi family protein [Candidatus Pantoea deserta]|uniref:Abi family protein n=1 Tax=Candidatus Pantoea deserta TaxID=1869313 RepID=A0A3N4NN17_9GAMM|nr:Abi family protein [Pantoea deserta]